MKNKTVLISGAITVFCTLLIFFLAVSNKQAIDYISLAFILIAEAAVLASIVYKKANDLEGIGVPSIVSIYGAASILFSLVFGRLMSNHLNIYILIHILMIAITLVILLFAHGIAVSNANHDKNTMRQLSVMRECEAMAQTLYLNANAENKATLKKVYETVKYVDKASDFNSMDIKIALENLKILCSNNEIDKLNEAADKVISLVNERAAYNTSLKHGNF